MKNYLLTGPPRSGKTTLLFKIMGELEKGGYKLGGILCPEIRKGRYRVGFEIVDLMSNERGILASVNIRSTYKISKYFVNVNAIDTIGVKAIEYAVRNADIIVIDEIGKMELVSKRFEEAVNIALDSPRPVLGVIVYKYSHPLVNDIKRRHDTKLYILDRNMPEHKRLEIAIDILINIRKIIPRDKTWK